MLRILDTSYVPSSVASRVIQHILIVPVLILCITHVSTGQNLEMLDQLEGVKIATALESVGYSLECFGDMFKESLLIFKEKGDAIAAIGKIPEMMLELKADMDVLKKTSVEDRLKVETYFEENKHLKAQLADKDKTIQLEHNNPAIAKLNETYIAKVAQLEQDLVAKSRENEQHVKTIEDAERILQTLKEYNKQEVQQKESEIEQFKHELEDKNNQLEQSKQDLITAREDNQLHVLKIRQLEHSNQATTKLNEKYIDKVAKLEQELMAKNRENEQQVKAIEDAERILQTLKEYNKQEVQQKESEIEQFKHELEDKNNQIGKLNRKISAAQIFAEQLKIKKQLEQFNSTKNWVSLRSSLETLLDPSSTAYSQLKNITNVEGSPMWKAGFRGYTELANVLLLPGLGGNMADSDGDTLLHGAVQGGYLSLIQMLLDSGADVEARGWKNSTPITRVGGNTQLETLKLLVGHGADVNGTRSDGSSSIHWAAFYGDLGAVKYLVDEGANTAARDAKGMTPLDVAQRRGRTEVVEFLSQLPH